MEAFSPEATRARAADWVEMNAYLNGRTTSSEVSGSQDIQAEDERYGSPYLDFDEDYSNGAELQDMEILEPEKEGRLDSTRDELARRQDTLGPLYPFVLVERASGWTVTRRHARTRSEVQAHVTYLACLLMTSARSEILKTTFPSELIHQIGDRFQAITYLTAGYLIGGTAFWMGSPRPDQTSMLDAMRTLAGRMGVGEIRAAAPSSASSRVKDGGLDLVVWKDFKDSSPGTVIIWGQVASGMDWKDKGIPGHQRRFINYYAKLPSVGHLVPIPALFVPRVAHDDVQESSKYSFEEQLADAFDGIQTDFGLIIDRIRLTELAAEVGTGLRFDSSELVRHGSAILKWTSQAIAAAKMN